ncbi:hypothetical protein [Sphingomonas sp. PB4P5]|uniref:hypothetical protein n=1 Tax=Parasphingomonas puruogangriensis TaxID=3096155 RepID=UPI002FCAD224
MTKFRFSARLLAGASLILLGPAMLGACAQTGATRFPSLLPRPIESRSDAEPVAPVVVAEPDPALDAQIATTMAAVETSTRDFAAAAARAESAARAARGAAVGSDRWLDAQTALADLDVFRADSSALVTGLDDAQIARAVDGKPPYPALETARAAAHAALDAQTARITAVQASLPEA